MLNILVRPGGFEPPTVGLWDRLATTATRRNVKKSTTSSIIRLSSQGVFLLCFNPKLTLWEWFCTRYGIRIRVAGMKILSPRPLDEPSVQYGGNIDVVGDPSFYNYCAPFIAVLTGLEPVISAVTGRHPNQLNDSTI